MRSAVRFRLPPELEAAAPPEARGLRRDHVRLLLVDRAGGSVEHHRFYELPRLLDPGDLLVVNDSRTLPASLLGRTAAGAPLEVRLAAREPGGPEPAGERWAALVLGVRAGGVDPALVPTDARPPAPALAARDRLEFAGGLGATVLGRHEEAPRLVWLAFDLASERLAEALHRAGRPVRYAYVPRAWPLHQYQTLFAAGPGSAEMASAGRPFTLQTLRDLRERGVGLATLSLHAGLSTYGDPATDRDYVPAEPYLVPEATVAAVAACRAAGGRVVAVGTTVVRALETAAEAGAASNGAASNDPGPGAVPRWGSVADRGGEWVRSSTAPRAGASLRAEVEVEAEAGAGASLRAGAGAGARADAEAEASLRASAGAGAWADADADAGPGAGAGVGVGVSLWAGAGVSRLRIGPGHRLAAVDGLLTGLHEPEASHLDLLAAFIDRPALDQAYAAALASGYLWHEFGDVCLLLPNGPKRRS